jgi:uncharacterized coiled-coil protein SlyX
MIGPDKSRDPAAASLGRTLDKTEAVAAEVQRASDDLAVINTVLEQELPEQVQVGDVAQAIEHTSHLEKKLAQSAETLAEVNAALTQEIEKRIEATTERDENQAVIDKLTARQRPPRSAPAED